MENIYCHFMVVAPSDVVVLVDAKSLFVTAVSINAVNAMKNIYFVTIMRRRDVERFW